jgi:hypothetical protein
MGGFGTARRLGCTNAVGARVATTVVLGALIAVAGQSGCGRDDELAVRTSRRGEVCRVASDCAEGLFCAPMPGGSGGGLCVTGNFRVAKTAKECAIVECAAAGDCCDGSIHPNPCENGAITCEVGKCVARCRMDSECALTNVGSRCAGGKCVQCALDQDCPPGLQCITGACQAPCTNDGACSGFDRCLAGRCIASGCQTDRECVAATRNVDARCGTDGKCIVPCETDLECGSPTSYSFFSCIDKQCTYVGCESDKDCRLFYTGPSDAGTLPPKQVAVCRDTSSVGDVVKAPAQP